MELPDNLKALFRPVAMVVPDLEMIARTLLLACGFLDATNLAEKAVLSLRLCREQLSAQGHYDFGMRALKSLLAAAAALKRSQPAADEGALVRRVLDDATRPKVVQSPNLPNLLSEPLLGHFWKSIFIFSCNFLEM